MISANEFQRELLKFNINVSVDQIANNSEYFTIDRAARIVSADNYGVNKRIFKGERWVYHIEFEQIMSNYGRIDNIDQHRNLINEVCKDEFSSYDPDHTTEYDLSGYGSYYTSMVWKLSNAGKVHANYFDIRKRIYARVQLIINQNQIKHLENRILTLKNQVQ